MRKILGQIVKKAMLFAFVLLTVKSFGQCPTIIWEDEFTGSALDLNKWSYQTGDGCAEGICGWGNNELQSYQQSNVTLANGQLHITAKKERIRGTSYTSGRIRTINKGDFTYGRMEARIKLPVGAGLWPAFWMLPTDEVYGGWPQSGEIDIMEFVAADTKNILGTIHYGDLYPNNQNQGGKFTLNEGSFPDQFHDFAIEWENGIIRWFMDGILYLTKTEADLAPYNWPFDQRFYFILNVAVGGNLGGPVDDSALPKTMDVEYVKVYNGFKPYITGDMVVLNQETNVTYSIGNVPNNTSVNWVVPSGATIVSGQGTKQIVVNFGNTSGNVTASFNTCSAQQLSIPVQVEPPFVKEFSFENFDETASVTLNSFTGTLTEVSNPYPTGVNTSSLVGKYIRNASQQYDLIVYNTTNITDGSLYTTKAKKFYMDVFTSAPVGTEILLQLETSTATSSNYPTGRHSRFIGKVAVQNSWQRIPFELLDEPDPGAADNGIQKMILLFASNTFTGDTYYYDNLDSYKVQTSTNVPPVVSITNPANGSSYPSGTNISITANATDSDGTISKVEFFVNGSSIGIDQTSPYQVNYLLGTGNYNLTATATDNAGATTSSSTVSVTGTSTTGSYLYVSSITTSTVSAGGGRMRGSATITILNNNGQPVSNATVTGTFSGTFNETVSGVTGQNGVATLQTTATAKGSVTVNICVTNVVHSTLSYNSSQNTITCTGGSAALVQQTTQEQNSVDVKTSPNPSTTQFNVNLNLSKQSNVNIAVLDMTGEELYNSGNEIFSEGKHSISFSNPLKGAGIYLIKVFVDGEQFLIRQMKVE